jgi:hypothetical protein
VDTAFILTGQSVLWRLFAGTHTVTNGTGSGDGSAGTLFDVPLQPGNSTFVFQFNSPGTFPFFCRFHEAFNMRGVVVVQDPVGVVHLGGGSGIGFVSDPAPNPTGGGVAFRFALSTAGRARLVVLDARGRVVAEPVDRYLGVGTYGASWDGNTRSGVRAASGVYYLRLTVPGLTSTRRVILAG